MQKLLVCLVLVVATLMSQVVRASDDQTLQNIAAGLQVITFVRDLSRDSKPVQANIEQNQSVLANNQVSIDPRYARRVIIDQSQMTISGRGKNILRDLMAARLSVVASNSGKVVVVIGPSDFGFTADLHDYVQESGRYSRDTTVQTPRGEWLAPTDIFKMNAFAQVDYDDRQLNGGKCRGTRLGIDIKYSIATANVHLILRPVDMRYGVVTGFEATGTVRKTVYYNVNGGASFGYAGASSNQVNPDEELLYQAMTQALAQLMSKMEIPGAQSRPAAQPIQSAAPIESVKPLVTTSGNVTFAFPSGRAFAVTLNDGKLVHQDDRIKFLRPGKVDAVAQYRVAAIAGQTILLELDYGTQPETTDGFKIVCTH